MAPINNVIYPINSGQCDVGSPGFPFATGYYQSIVPTTSGFGTLGLQSKPWDALFSNNIDITGPSPSIQSYGSGYNLTIASSGTNSAIIFAAANTEEFRCSGMNVVTQSGIALVPQLSGFSQIGTKTVPYGSGYFNNLYSPVTSKAWVVFSGIGAGTSTILAAYNISKVTRLSTAGTYQITYSQPLSAIQHFSTLGKIDSSSADGAVPTVGLKRIPNNPTTTGCTLSCVSSSNATVIDCELVCLQIFAF